MTEEKPPIIKKPVGRARWIIGIILATYGVFVSAWNTWRVATNELPLSEAQQLRFGFVLWIGSVLFLFGLWLMFRSRLAAAGAILAFLVPPVVFFLAVAF